MKKGEIQWAGFWLAGLLCLVLATLKVTQTVSWSWWRVLLPIWVVLVHTAVYIAVGFIWLTWMEGSGECRAVPESQQRYRYLFGSMVCSLIFMDNVLRRIGGAEESVRCWLASGRPDVLLLSGGVMLACQFLFWSGIVTGGKTRGVEQRGARRR